MQRESPSDAYSGGRVVQLLARGVCRPCLDEQAPHRGIDPGRFPEA
jgi:hypothetical protein